MLKKSLSLIDRLYRLQCWITPLMTPSTEIESYTKIAALLADTARSVIRPLFRRALLTQNKDDTSPVTIADRSAERVMRALLAEYVPDHGVFGEEFGHDNPHSLYQWVLDPIDGTRAFITGRPLFGTLIALLKDGVPLLGVLDQPILNERWLGIIGQPTVFSSPFGGHVGTRQNIRLTEAEMSCTAPEILQNAPHDRWLTLHNKAKRITWGGDCYAYGLLALGHIDLITECTMNLWDWAALVPIIQGAGGFITQWDGTPLQAGGDGTVLATSSAELHQEAVAILTNKPTDKA